MLLIITLICFYLSFVLVKKGILSAADKMKSRFSKSYGNLMVKQKMVEKKRLPERSTATPTF